MGHCFRKMCSTPQKQPAANMATWDFGTEVVVVMVRDCLRVMKDKRRDIDIEIVIMLWISEWDDPEKKVT